MRQTRVLKSLEDLPANLFIVTEVPGAQPLEVSIAPTAGPLLLVAGKSIPGAGANVVREPWSRGGLNE